MDKIEEKLTEPAMTKDWADIEAARLWQSWLDEKAPRPSQEDLVAQALRKARADGLRATRLVRIERLEAALRRTMKCYATPNIELNTHNAIAERTAAYAEAQAALAAPEPALPK